MKEGKPITGFNDVYAAMAFAKAPRGNIHFTGTAYYIDNLKSLPEGPGGFTVPTEVGTRALYINKCRPHSVQDARSALQ